MQVFETDTIFGGYGSWPVTVKKEWFESFFYQNMWFTF